MNFELLREQLTRHEGCMDKPYTDSVGKLTIGIGHNLEDRPLSQEVIQLIFKEDIDVAISDCQKMFPNWHSIPDTKQVVICNMMFNLGYTVLSRFVRFRRAVRAEQWARAADEMKDSKWYRQVKSRGVELEILMRS
jgi:lysozyme